MKKYLVTFALFLFSLFSFSQRYGRMSDVYEQIGEESILDTPMFDLFFIVFLGVLVTLFYVIMNAEEIYRNILANFKRLFYSKWMFIPLYCIYLTLNLICLNVGKDRKPYETWNADRTDIIPQTQEECFYPFRHFEGGTGQCEPLYAYDINEFILYGFFIPIVLFILYILLRKLTNSIWLDAIYTFLTIWSLIAFFIPIIFYSDGSECGFWGGWLPSIFLTVHFFDKKEVYIKSLEA